MDGNRLNGHRSRAAWVVAAALACLGLVAAPAAIAAPGHGSAELRLAQHDKGRTLSGQGVEVVAGLPARQEGSGLTLPIATVEPSAIAAAAAADGWLRFKRGKRGVVLSALRFDLTAATVSGKLGDEELIVFRFSLPQPVQVDAAAGRVALGSGKLRLTAQAATLLKQRLGLERALMHRGVGMLWLLAQANPARVSVPVVSGDAGWGVLASWRKYIVGFQGPGSTGTITTADGAIANGNLAEASGYFGFPATGGTFERGVYGATDRLVLRTRGSVTFAKPGHCIVEVKLADLVVTLDGADSSLALDSVYDIDVPAGPGSCDPRPAVATEDVTFASLDLTGVAPVYSAGGKAITWSAIPATLTAAGSAAFGLPQYQEGQPLDPVTVTVGLG